MNSNYVCYHLHTEDSLLDSCTNYKLYVDKAVELGQTAIAFTEHGNTFNWIEKKMYANEKGLKFIFGIEVYLTETLDEKIRDNYHTILLAKNYDGIREINILNKLASDKLHKYYKPRLSFNEFLNISNNVIKISACLASPLNHYRNSKTYDESTYQQLLKAYDYYEIQPHNNSDQIEYNKYLFEMSKHYNKPLIAATDTHSVDSYKAECRKVLLDTKEIMFNEDGANEDELDLTYKSFEELKDMFRVQNALPKEVYLEAIEMTNVLADMIEDKPLDTTVKYPSKSDNEEKLLKQRIVKMLSDKLKNGVIPESEKEQFKENILEEFRVFKKINMVGFMLFMSELITWCWENNIPVGYCRGSVGGSSIAHVTDIIDLDPVKWKTVFSRFANEDREEVGDIDIDISPDQRDMVYKHIIDSFGEDYTAYILATGTIVDRGAIDDIGRALSYRWIDEHYCEDMNNFKKRRQLHALHRNDNDNPYNLDTVAQIKEMYLSNPESTKEKYKELFYYFDGMKDTVVSQSMHPAGIVVSPISLTDNYGVFWSDDKLILCINMDEVHECGLVKYDILGLKNIEIIRKTCEYAGIPYPKSHEINWDDEKVWNDLITSPVGIFQFESSYAFDLTKKFKPRCINDLSLVNASLRPSGETYRDRLLARESNHNPSELIDELLKDNNGYLVFQEDTIKFLKDICGLSGSEADNVRRAIGRKQVDRLQKALPRILNGYCEMSDKPREVAELEAKEFLDIIESSSRYQFGYNHSTGYSMIGYTCAYLRYYYPEEFIAAYLNCANNDDDILNGTELAKVKGIKIHDVKFGKSGSGYTIDKKNHSLYKGVASIKYMNKQIADELLALSKNKYNSFITLLYDIKDYTSVNDRQLTILITLNFFSDFGSNGKLLKIKEMFDKFYKVKTLKKDKLESLGLSDYVAQKYAEKETPKQYSGIDNLGLLHYLTKNLQDNCISIPSQIKAEEEYLGYVTYVNPDMKEYYVVLDYKVYNDPCRPYFSLYNLSTGEKVSCKINDRKIYNRNPFGHYSIIHSSNFVKSDDKWTPLERYEVIKR